MKGTIPNQAKKHKKKAIDVIQNVRVDINEKFNNSNLVALEFVFIVLSVLSVF